MSRTKFVVLLLFVIATPMYLFVTSLGLDGRTSLATPPPVATEEASPEPATATPTPTATATPTATSKPSANKSFETLVLHIRDVDVWNDAAMTALETELEAHGVDLMTYWGVLAEVSRTTNILGFGGEVVSTDTYRLWVTRDGDLLNVRVYQ